MDSIYIFSAYDLQKLLDGTQITTVYWNLDQKLENLPVNLHTLHLGYMFDRKLENLPVNLHTLLLGAYFNQELENLPDNLHTLRLGYCFSQNLHNLSPGLCELQINKYNRNIDYDYLKKVYTLDITYNALDIIMKIKGKKGMFTKSSNKI